MKTNILIVLALVIGFSLTVRAQEETKTEKTVPPTYTAQDYENLLAKLKGGDTGIDYTALRMAFTQTKNYSFHGADKAATEKFFAPYTEKSYKDALKQAEKFLETDYVDANAHFVAYNAAKELKDEQKSNFHKAVLLGLLTSMKNGNDGLSEKTPFKVITIDEEYTMLRFLGYKNKSQSLQSADGHQFDVLTAINLKTKETVKYYFDIDVVWAAENKIFKK